MENVFHEMLERNIAIKTRKGLLAPADMYTISLDPVKDRYGNVTSEANLSDTLRSYAENITPVLSDKLSFLTSLPTVNTEDEIVFEFLKEVYLYRKDKANALANARDTKKHNAKIDMLVAKKTEDEMEKMSVEDLLKLKK